MAHKNIDNLIAEDETIPALKPRSKAVVNANTVSDDKVTIYLEENDAIPPTGQFLQVNGRSFMLRPGETVEVPRVLLNILDQAVQSVPVVDRLTQQVVGYRDRLRFPYRLVRDAQAA